MLVTITIALNVIDKLRDITHVDQTAHLLLVEHIENFDFDDALALVNRAVWVVSLVSL